MKASDVFISNHVSGKLVKPDFGFEELKQINPRLIYVTISGFGSYDPYRKKPGYDIIASAFGGLSSITGPKVSNSKQIMVNLLLSRVGVRIVTFGSNLGGKLSQLAFLQCEQSLSKKVKLAVAT